MNNATPENNAAAAARTELTALHAGQAALAIGKRAAAIRDLEFAASFDNGHAHYLLGLCHRTKAKREYHLRRAALEFGHADAKAELGVIEANARNFPEASRLAREAMLAGSQAGTALLAEMFVKGNAVSPDKEEIACCAGTLAVKGVTTAHVMTARVLLSGAVSAMEGFLALGHLAYAVTCHGEPAAIFLFGQLQYGGIILDKDEERGIAAMFQAASKDHLPAVMHLLGMAIGGVKNEMLFENKDNLIRHGAALGNKEAAAMLAKLDAMTSADVMPADTPTEGLDRSVGG